MYIGDLNYDFLDEKKCAPFSREASDTGEFT